MLFQTSEMFPILYYRVQVKLRKFKINILALFQQKESTVKVIRLKLLSFRSAIKNLISIKNKSLKVLLSLIRKQNHYYKPKKMLDHKTQMLDLEVGELTPMSTPANGRPPQFQTPEDARPPFFSFPRICQTTTSFICKRC